MVAPVKPRSGSVPSSPFGGPGQAVSVDPPAGSAEGFMPDGRPFDFGTEVDFDSLSRLSAPTGSPEDQVREWWPLFCEECGFVSSTKKIPTLIEWRKSEHNEMFRVRLTGKFASPVHRTAISVSLRASRLARQMVVIDSGPSEITVILSHFELPWPFEFDLRNVPLSDDQVHVGVLGEGSLGVWDTTVQTHMLVAGLTGGGKSEAVETILSQFNAKDWQIIVFTPYEDDPSFDALRADGHLVLGGLKPEHLERNVKVLRWLIDEEFPRRSVERAAAGVKVWGLPARRDDFVGWDGRKLLCVWEESGEFLMPGRGDSELKRAMKAVAVEWNDVLSAQGRKNRCHGLWINQQPLVDRFGGGNVLREIGARLALGWVDKSYHHVLFQSAAGEAPNPVIGEVLLNRSTPAGRGVCSGLVAVGSEFDLADVVVQVAWADEDQRAVLFDRLRGGYGDVVDVVESPPVLTADAGVDPEPEPVAEPVVVAGPLPPRAGLPPWLSPSFVAVSCSFGACGVMFAAAVRFLI